MRVATPFGSLLLLVCSAIVTTTSATVLLKPFSIAYPDLPAKYTAALNRSGICGILHVADPVEACSSLRNRFEVNGTEEEGPKIALIARGECTFEDKIRNAQKGGFQAAIVFDDVYRKNLLYMMVNPRGITVHAVFVSKAAGEVLKTYAQLEGNECCINPPHNLGAWNVLGISFLSLIVILGFLAIAFLISRHWLLWRQVNYHGNKSMDTRMVEALPQVKFNSAHSSRGHTGETCAICLEDYKEGEVLKVLPCLHEFHSSCVDSWLTKWGTFCPVCKLDLKTKFSYPRV